MKIRQKVFIIQAWDVFEQARIVGCLAVSPQTLSSFAPKDTNLENGAQSLEQKIFRFVRFVCSPTLLNPLWTRSYH